MRMNINQVPLIKENFSSHEFAKKTSLIEVINNLGISVPQFCYSSYLTIPGNCRICIVELKSSLKPLLSCLYSSDQKNDASLFFYTNSPFARQARESILEFLLINHPLDCPICDQAGECDLQDLSLNFGSFEKKFYSFKRTFVNDNFGILIKTVMSRCIHCTKCVRFLNEIAATSELGLLNRGHNTEINTYINRLNFSEFSGNIVDLCPVGALTHKFYPFIEKRWEVKSVLSFDLLNSFRNEVSIEIFNNKIQKILPKKQKSNSADFTWITDKSRFSFDGMFASDKVSNNFLVNGSKHFFYPYFWKNVFFELTQIIFFQEHLNRHYLNKFFLVIVFDNWISLENLNFLLILRKKYNFLKLTKMKKEKLMIDQEKLFLTNESLKNNLFLCDLCVLVGINTKYECSNLNLNLKRKYKSKKFLVISFSSLINLDFSLKYVGFNFKLIKALFEGNSLVGQKLANSKKTMFIIGHAISKRNDSLMFFSSYESFKKIVDNAVKNKTAFNLINGSNNDSGINYLKKFKELKHLNYNSLYFINLSDKNSLLKKLIKIKLLNFIPCFIDSTYTYKAPFAVVKNTLLSSNLYDNDIAKLFFVINQSFSSYINENFLAKSCFIYLNLSNTNFFEESCTFMSTDKLLKKNVKLVFNKHQAKESWKIFRKIIFLINNITFINFISNKLIFNTKLSKDVFRFFSILQFSNAQLCALKKVFLKDNFSYLLKKNKIFFSNIKLWLDDFFIGGDDVHTNSSYNMINLSKALRFYNGNFK